MYVICIIIYLYIILYLYIIIKNQLTKINAVFTAVFTAVFNMIYRVVAVAVFMSPKNILNRWSKL
jgi:hypothetical protein